MSLAVLTILSLISWFKLLLPEYRKKEIAKYLRSHNKLGSGEKEKEMFYAFVNDYLHLDGAFILCILRRNSNYITSSEIVCTLWSRFCREYIRSHSDAPKSIVIGGEEEGASAKTNTEVHKIGMFDYQENEKMPFKKQY